MKSKSIYIFFKKPRMLLPTLLSSNTQCEQFVYLSIPSPPPSPFRALSLLCHLDLAALYKHIHTHPDGREFFGTSESQYISQ